MVVKLAQEAYKLTNGAFDVTVGALAWKALTAPVGTDELEIQPSGAFRFRRDPKRLTFGGIAKGAATGVMAAILRDADLHDFRIDAGGGNLALSANAAARAGLSVRKSPRTFRPRDSSSCRIQIPTRRAAQTSSTPKLPTRSLSAARKSHAAPHVCYGSRALPKRRIADALSKAFLINPEFDALPPECESQVHQGR